MRWLATWQRRLRGSPAQRGMTIAVIEGALVGGFIAFIEAWMVPVLLKGTGNPGHAIGWLNIVPLCALLTLSPFAPRIIALLGGNKRTAIVCASVQVVGLALLAIPLLYHDASWSAPTALVLAILVNIVGAVAGPAYFGWMGDLIPRSIRGRYWSNRMRVLIGFKLAFAAFFAALFAFGENLVGVHASLLAILAIAVVSRAASVWLLGRQPVAAPRRGSLSRELEAAAPAPGFVQAMWRTDLGRWTAVWATLHFGVMIAGPFFGPYMLADAPVGLDLLDPEDGRTWRYSLLLWTSNIVRLAMLPAMGRMVDRYGPGAVLRVAVIGIMIVPLAWAWTTSLPLLMAVEVASGLTWCAAESAVGVLLLSAHRNAAVRARLIAFHQMPVGGVAMLATWTGMELMRGGVLPELSGSEYRFLFVLTMLLRLPAVFLAWRLLPGLAMPMPSEWLGVWRLIPGVQPTLTLSRGVIRFFRRPDDS